MIEIEPLIARLDELGQEWWCPGPVPESDIVALEHGLGVRLPDSYRRFLMSYGGGGIVAIFELCQLEQGNPLDLSEGSVFGQTMHDRRETGLPPLAVVIFRDDEIVHYLDLGRASDPPVTVRLVDSDSDETRDWEPNFLSYLKAELQHTIADTEKYGNGS